ncbi:MAG TPA: protein-L-isoaspartate O-methyltransferase [Bryobacteraceae bacterium]|nr:protein-L-isoaspartate O-methyltransferase [Bryobacteraceae bacterium]
MLDSAQQRANMVATQLRTNDVTDPRLIRAILSIPREAFVPAHLAPLAYMEGCIPLGNGRVLLDPRSFGKMAQLAAIRPEDRVLDVGCGTGYSTAVFSHLAAHVIGLEHDRDLAEMAGTNLQNFRNAELAVEKLNEGLRAKAPYDVIFLNGAVERAPDNLIEQLSNRGRLVCVVRDGAAGHARMYLKDVGAISERSTFDADLPVLPGFERARSFAF